MTAPITDPVASIVIPSYRGAARLPALLDSLAAQEAGTPPFEVIVVVDGVDDGSAALVESETRTSARAIQLPENRGRVTALNTGFDAARGNVLIRCDDDLVPGPAFVKSHVAAHVGRRCGAVGLYRNVFEPTRYAEVYGEDADARFRADAYTVPASHRWRFWAGNCSVTRAVWEEVGPYDTGYRLYGWEDVDYGYRLHRAGVDVELVPQLETVHRVAAVTTASRAQRAAYSGAARRIFEASHGNRTLSPAVPPWSLWNGVVRLVAPVTGRWPRTVGRIVDRVIRAAPGGIARKLVALTVESASLGGYRRARAGKEQF